MEKALVKTGNNSPDGGIAYQNAQQLKFSSVQGRQEERRAMEETTTAVTTPAVHRTLELHPLLLPLVGSPLVKCYFASTFFYVALPVHGLQGPVVPPWFLPPPTAKGTALWHLWYPWTVTFGHGIRQPTFFPRTSRLAT